MPCPPEDRVHPVLGRLHWHAAISAWACEIELIPGCRIDFHLVVEDAWQQADPQEVFAAGLSFLDWARSAETLARARIADDYLDIYNESWADDDPEEGPPTLDRAAFVAQLRPTGVSLYATGASEWMYDAGELFAGHAVSVGADEHRVFGRASLFG